MPRGYRYIVAAALGWLILANTADKDSKPQSTNTVTARYAESGFDKIASAIKEANKSPKRDPGCDPYHENRQSDLCAQWKSADAASDSFRAAVVGLIIGSLTLLAAGFAAWYARNAWLDTQRGADAAEASHKAFVERERGWLKIIGLANNQFGVVFTVRNIGPALLEITGVISDTETLWPNEPSGQLGDYRIKIPSGNSDSIPIGVGAVGDVQVTACGYISYRTLGLEDCRTYFGVHVKPGRDDSGLPYAPTALDAMFQPRDT